MQGGAEGVVCVALTQAFLTRRGPDQDVFRGASVGRRTPHESHQCAELQGHRLCRCRRTPECGGRPCEGKRKGWEETGEGGRPVRGDRRCCFCLAERMAAPARLCGGACVLPPATDTWGRLSHQGKTEEAGSGESIDRVRTFAEKGKRMQQRRGVPKTVASEQLRRQVGEIESLVRILAAGVRCSKGEGEGGAALRRSPARTVQRHPGQGPTRFPRPARPFPPMDGSTPGRRSLLVPLVLGEPISPSSLAGHEREGSDSWQVPLTTRPDAFLIRNCLAPQRRSPAERCQVRGSDCNSGGSGSEGKR